jgi:hypothetical protein
LQPEKQLESLAQVSGDMAVTQRRLAKAPSGEDQCPWGLGGRLLDMEMSDRREHQDTEAECKASVIPQKAMCLHDEFQADAPAQQAKIM